MNAGKLTNRASLSHKRRMRKARAVLVAMVGSGLAAGCISVTAPDKPIVIELNINIKQEVIYRLAPGAQNTIEENSDIF
jgi:hypothetical protein